MNAAVGLMDGLGLDGDRCIRVIPRQDPPIDFYSPQTKLREGNIFTPVWDSVRGGVCLGGSVQVRETSRTVKSGQYAFYWNAFLLKKLICHIRQIKLTPNRKRLVDGNVLPFSF